MIIDVYQNFLNHCLSRGTQTRASARSQTEKHVEKWRKSHYTTANQEQNPNFLLCCFCTNENLLAAGPLAVERAIYILHDTDTKKRNSLTRHLDRHTTTLYDLCFATSIATLYQQDNSTMEGDLDQPALFAASLRRQRSTVHGYTTSALCEHY